MSLLLSLIEFSPYISSLICTSVAGSSSAAEKLKPAAPPSSSASSSSSTSTASASSSSSAVLRVAQDPHNKSFFLVPASSLAPSPARDSPKQAVLLPATGQRPMVISRSSDGHHITIRPTVPADILEAMKTKIYTVGIFPYLLLNDYKRIEKVLFYCGRSCCVVMRERVCYIMCIVF